MSTIRFSVTIRVPSGPSQGDLPGLLDMLRYEGGRVVDWHHDRDKYCITIEVEELRHQPDRWASFGILVRGQRTAGPAY